MNDTGHRHWTEDEDQLERFVLNRLPPEERGALEHHLQSCETCRMAVQEERALAAGIRSAGRHQLKTRLTGRVGRAPHRQIPWERLVGMAAVLVVLIGVGIYNGWFSSQTEKETLIVSKEEKAHEDNRAAASADRKDAGREELRPRTFARTEPQPPPATPHRQNPAGNEQGYLDKSDFATSKPDQDAYREKDMAAKNATGAPPATDATSEISRRTGEPAEVAASLSQTLWVEGNVLPSSSPGVVGESVNRKSAGQRKELRAGTLDKSSALRDQATNIQQVEGRTITLRQQPAAALPAAQQTRQMSVQGEKVQTRVDKTGQSLDMTIYLDSLADEEELQNVTIQPVTDDSLVVDIANKRIGYRIPGGWNSNTSQKAKTQKQSNDSR